MTDNKLYFLIKDTPAVAEHIGDNAAVVAALNEQSEPQTDTTRRDSNWVTNNLTAAEADAVLGSLQQSTSPRVIAANAMLAGAGIDLSNPTVQALVPQIAAADEWPDGLAEKILESGVWSESVYESKNGRGSVCTLEQVEAALRWHEIHQRLADKYNEARGLIDADSGNTVTWDDVAAILTQD